MLQGAPNPGGFPHEPASGRCVWPDNLDIGCTPMMVSEVPMFYYPGNLNTAMRELVSYCDRSHLVGIKALPTAVELWKTAVVKLVNQAVSDGLEIISARFRGAPVIRSCDARDVAIPLIIERTALDSSIGYLWSNVPEGYELTKAGYLLWCKERPEEGGLSKLLEGVGSAEVALRSTGGVGLPIRVFSKDEPISMKKALEGRHRVICMPEWPCNIVEHLYSSWVVGERLFTFDDVVSETNCYRAGGRWCFGSDVAATLWELPMRNTIDYDVKAWDRSLPYDVVLAFYSTAVFDPVIARALCVGQNSRGYYYLGGNYYKLPPGVCAWCSGSPKTLSGNSLIHAALLESGNIQGVVMGDDGCAWDCGVDDITSLFSDVGMVLKEVRPVIGYDFCKLRRDENGVEVDAKAIMEKCVSRNSIWSDREHIVRDALVQFAKRDDLPIRLRWSD